MLVGGQRPRPGRRSDRGPQGDDRPSGAARPRGHRRPVADPAPARSAARRHARSSPPSSSTKWGISDDRHGTTGLVDGRAGSGSGAPIDAPFVSGGTQNEIYEIRRGDVHGALRIPPPSAPDDPGRRDPARVADHRGAGRDGRPAHGGHRRVRRTRRSSGAPSTSWATWTAGRR